MSKDTKPLGKAVQIDEARIEDHLVTVGIAITSHPPHRTGRALLTHTATTLGIWRKSVAQDKGEQFQVSVSKEKNPDTDKGARSRLPPQPSALQRC